MSPAGSNREGGLVLPSPLYVICDVDACTLRGVEPSTFARTALRAGARVIQVRAKSSPADAFLALVSEVLDAAAGVDALVVVNDRADVARLAGAPGLHIGQDDLSPADARAVLPDTWLGLSTHTPAQLAAAIDAPVDYVAVGPVFGTRTKDTGYAPVGLDLVRQARALHPARPVVAIGGITRETAGSVLAAGADAVAVIGALLDGDPAVSVAAWLDELHGKRAV